MRRCQAGFSLVELMISLVLGLLISALAVQMFMASRASLSTQEALSFLQESTRYVSYRLQPLMRNIGYAGCANNYNIIFARSLDATYDLMAPLGGITRTHRGLSYWNMTFVAADKDAGEISLNASMDSRSGALNIESGAEEAFEDGNGNQLEKVALVSDCRSSDVFTVSSIADGSIDTNDKLSRLYGSRQSSYSYVYPVKAWELFLGDQSGNNGVRSLYLDRIGTSFPAEEIASGVTGFVITFSLDTNGDGQADMPNKAASSMSGDDWKKVRRIEIALTLETQPGAILGGANQGRLQRTFNLTFAPRNLKLTGGG